MNVTIRIANTDDIESLLKMRKTLWPDSREAHLSELIDILNKNSALTQLIFIAEIDGSNAIGFLELGIRNYAEGSEESKVPYIEGWFVAKAYRKKGIGRRLVQEAEMWSKDHHYNELASDAELQNQRSIDAHKRLGFEEQTRVVTFLKNLDT